MEVRERDERGRAAADAVEQRHHLRHRGHLHGARRVRPDRRRRSPSRSGSTRSSSRCGVKNVATIATVMPKAPTRLPLPRACRVREELEREDEADDRDQVREVDPVGPAHASFVFLRLGRRLLRLEHLEHPVGDDEAADDVARARARPRRARRSAARSAGPGCPATMIAPTMTMPWIAFVPDISGVCSSVGTFEITSTPRKRGEDQDGQLDQEAVGSRGSPPSG